jgi:RNA recognition motif-containing protein
VVQVTKVFSQCGEVVNVRLPFDREQECLKGFGFVEFAEKDSVAKAGELHDTYIFDRQVWVDTNPSGGGAGKGDSAGKGKGGGKGKGKGGKGGGKGGKGAVVPSGTKKTFD